MLRYENQSELLSSLSSACQSWHAALQWGCWWSVCLCLKTQQPVYLRWRPNCWVMQTLLLSFLRMSPGRCAALRCDVKGFEKPSAVTTQLIRSNHLKPTCSQSEPISTERHHLILISFKWDCDLYLRWGFSCRPSSELRHHPHTEVTSAEVVVLSLEGASVTHGQKTPQ